MKIIESWFFIINLYKSKQKMIMQKIHKNENLASYCKVDTGKLISLN